MNTDISQATPIHPAIAFATM